MLSPRVLLVLACAVLALAGTCTAFINTADMTHSLPYDHANVSRGRFMHVFRGSTTKPTDNAFVFVNDADSLTFDVATNAPASIFSTYQARFNASFFFIPLRFHQASTGVPPFEHRDTVHMEHMVNDLHVLLTEHDILKKIPKIVLVGTGRGGAVAAHYRALYATLNRRVLGAFVDTPHMRKLTYSRIFSPPSGVSADCTGAIASAIKDIDNTLRQDTTPESGAVLKQKFNLCAAPPIGMTAVERAFFWFQLSYPIARYMHSPHSMYANTPRSPDAICERFTMKDNVTELAAVHKVMRWNPASCLDVDMNSALTTGPVLDLFQGSEIAYSCSGGLAIPTTDGIYSPFAPYAISRDLYDDVCRLYLGPKFSIATASAAADRIERNLGSNTHYTGSHVFFVRSSADPLAEAADIYVPEPVNTLVRTSTIRGYAFRAPEATDSTELREIKRKISVFVDKLFTAA